MSWSVQANPITAPISLSGVVDRGAPLAENLGDSLIAYGAARRNRELLLSGEAVCVTTGQQPGLLTGPVMTIYKALSAAALADRLTESMGRPVVPVFWVAGDDHDFEEANHLHLISAANEVSVVTLRDREATGPALPIHQEVLGQDIGPVFELIREITPDTEFRESVLDRCARHYTPDNTMASAFAHFVADVLSEMGIVVFEPYTNAAKRAVVPLMKSAITDAARITRGVMERNDQLLANERQVPVAVHEDHTMVMMLGAEGRDRIIMDGDQFLLRRSGERFTGDDLLGLLESEPARFSPNVLLRPVVEAQLLPTVVYVAGPTERAYWEQTGPIFDTLGVTQQVALPRWSGHVVEPRVIKVLEKYELSMEDLSLPDGQLESRLARDELPDELRNAIAQVREVVTSGLADIARMAIDIESTLEKPVLGAQRQMLSQVDHVEGKIVTQLKRRNDVLMRQIATARTAMFPLQKPQERVINVLQYLIRHGPEYFSVVMSACRTWAADLESATPVA